MSKVRYRVLKKAFIGDVLHQPGDIVEAAPGLQGAALQILQDAPTDRAGGPGNAPATDLAAQRIAALEVDIAALVVGAEAYRKEAEGILAVESARADVAEKSVADLQAQLGIANARIADLEGMLAAPSDSQDAAATKGKTGK